MSTEYKKPSEFKKLTKEQLAYKLAEAYSFIAEIDSEQYLPRFQRKYADWFSSTNTDTANDKKEPPKKASLKPEEFTEAKMNDLWNACRYWYEKDDYDHTKRDYDLDTLFDNIEEAEIDYKKPSTGYYQTVDEYVADRYKGKMTVDQFLDKWLAIIRSKTVGQFDGNKLIQKCLDMQDNRDVGCYLGAYWADKYTDDDIREFFRRCWYH